MHVAMADTLGFHGNGDLSDGDGRIYYVAFDGHFIFSMFHFICYLIVFGFQFARKYDTYLNFRPSAAETTCVHKHNLGSDQIGKDAQWKKV